MSAYTDLYFGWIKRTGAKYEKSYSEEHTPYFIEVYLLIVIDNI
jgi:hypothetical protein